MKRDALLAGVAIGVLLVILVFVFTGGAQAQEGGDAHDRRAVPNAGRHELDLDPPKGATGPASLTGIASWYCGAGSRCTIGYGPSDLVGAAGPRLRAALGDWRGQVVRVCSATACVRVRLVDWCWCPDKLVDLTSGAFGRLAPLSRGLVRVTITWGAGILPATDT